MGYVNSVPLIDRFSTEPARGIIADFFDALSLPLPKAHQSYSGSSFRHLTFLNDCGVVIRLTLDSAQMGFDNPHFIKPLLVKKFGDLEFAIDPGIDCPVMAPEAKMIYAYLEGRYGIKVSDAKNYNLGFLPGKVRDFPIMIDLEPIHISRKAVDELSETPRTYREYLELDQPGEGATITCDDNPQIRFYQELRGIAQNAWPDGEKPDKTCLREFLAACRDFKHQGKLLSRWEDRNYQGTKHAAANYHAHRFPA